MARIIDPPSGWKYGFPMPYTPEEGETIEDFLLRNGYPQEELDVNGKVFWCRFWEEPDGNTEPT